MMAKQDLARRKRLAKRFQRVENNVIEAVNTKGNAVLEAIKDLQRTVFQKRLAEPGGTSGSKKSRGVALLDFRAKDLFVQSELERFFALREALEFSDVSLLHGRGVAESVWSKLSGAGRATYQDSTFQNMLGCSSTWELDGCTAEEISGCSAVKSGELSVADLFRVCATRLCLNNAEILAEATAEGALDMERFDPERLWGTIGQRSFLTGVQAHAYTFLARGLKKPTAGRRKGVKWGFCRFAEEILIPALRAGLLDELYAARETSISQGLGTEAANQAVETLLSNVLHVPPVLRYLILRDLGLLTCRSSRGSLYDLDHCWGVLSGQEEGLLGVVSVNDRCNRDSNERALKLLWTPYLEHRNLALAALLPKPHPPTLQHQCGVKGKFEQGEDRPGPRPRGAEPRAISAHQEALRTYWRWIAPHAPELLMDAGGRPRRGGS